MSHEEDREQTSSQVSALPSQSEVREEPVYTRWPTCGFWWRAVAHSFDTAVISTITSVGFLLFLFMFGESFFQEIITQAQNSGGEAENNLSGMQVAFSTLGSFLSVALLLLYGVGSEGSSRSATPGKLLMGLRVATEDGQPLLYSDAFVRNLYKHLLLVVGGVLGLVIAPLSLSSPLLGGIVAIVTAIALILLFIYTIIDPLLAVFSSKNQTLHDRWSYSIVVKKPGVNRWLRLLLTLFAIFLLFAGQATLVTAIAFSQLQNLTPKYMEQFEMNAEGMDFSDTDPFGGAPLPRG
ncbi:RDD family protein, partial [bacterium]|nr:RDD family protein [bacterium]